MALFFVLWASALGIFVVLARSRVASALALLVGMGSLVLAVAWQEPRADHVAVPKRHREGGFVGSTACRSCHPSEHASWGRTFHRTMTQEVTDESFLPELPATLELDERTYELRREGTARGLTRNRDPRLFVTGPDIHRVADVLRVARERNFSREKVDQLLAQIPRVERELVLLTGSHHYQAFWVEGGEGRELRQLPFVYLIDEGRFLPRREAFLQPPDAPSHIARWNANCVQCHSVAGRPGQSETTAPPHLRAETGLPSSRPSEGSSLAAEDSRYETTVAELGIACEACHGPGGEHVEHYQNPVARYAAEFAAEDERRAFGIINPAKLDAPHSSAVCGQCHSYFLPRDADEWWESGFSKSYWPGTLLDDSRLVLDYERDRERDLPISRQLESVFWPDGTIRVGGREYNGLVRSPCYERGEGERQMSCLSCHSMHGAPPEDQLAPKTAGDRMCTQCHDAFERELAAHTHHSAESSGSRCVNCHMPLTSYALLKGIRSHRITSPVAREDVPNACNLCHLDRSLEWTRRALEAKWGAERDAADRTPPEELAEEGARESSNDDTGAPQAKASLPASVRWLLAGNAAERALLAYAYGWPDAVETSGGPWQRPLLSHLERDPYAAVRLIAARSARGLPEDLAGPRELVDGATIVQLTEVRDDRPITISE